ncbi:hypothetical protein A4G99_23245 [Haladaptatus sp. R4]|uniref:hypothetical protein n=1 Tax=Haladaptatus sp. R4 TaxID=1679489 RepID=UPI0007B4A631|nr:hypothetical protein [Haladaptatus sp. R4]KZN26090.1 hypothetical protein A4G99_23245 [Haladaptatus sp. R4]
MSDGDPSFSIPHRPRRTYPRRGGVRYEGETLFRLSPDSDPSENDLTALVERVLDGDAYTYGDWFDLPVPMYLVRDREHDTTFRVVVRYGSVELHILPDTRSEGLKSIYRRLSAESPVSWNVSCESNPEN